MPITPHYTWSETEKDLTVRINGVPVKDQGQLLCSDCVLKVNVAPYLLLLDLFDTVAEDQSKATVKGTSVQFHLAKAKPGIWGQLTAEGDKQELKKRREASMQRLHERDAACSRQRQELKQKSQKEATDRQIEQDRLKRLQLEAAKTEELQQERQELQQWQKNLLPGSTHQEQQQLVEQGDESEYEPSDEEELVPSQQVLKQKQQPQQESVMPDHPDYHGKGWSTAKAAAAAAGDALPPPIATRVQEINARQEPESTGNQTASGATEGATHPSSSSSNRSIKESSTSSTHDIPFLQPGLQAPGASSSGGCVQLLLEEDEQDEGGPRVLDSILCASSSSSSKFDCSSGEATIMAQAAAPLLQEVQTVRSRSDASALSRQKDGSSSSSSREESNAGHAGPGSVALTAVAGQVAPPPPPVRASRAPVPVGFTQLETPHLPARETRELEIKALKKAQRSKGLEDSIDVADRQPAFLKDKGDALYAQHNYKGAINAYSRALSIEPDNPKLLSNRAACHLQLGDNQDCIDDCSRALDLLRERHPWAAPREGSQKPQLPLQAAASATTSNAAMADEATDASTAADGGGGDRAESQCGCEFAADGAVHGDAAHVDLLEEGSEAGCSRRQKHRQDADGRAGLQAEDSMGGAEPGASSQADGAAAAAAVVGRHGQDEERQKLRMMLVKLLSRRAAASAELGEVQQAMEDLSEALRFDPANATLAADLEELQMLLEPLDAAALQERAAARYKAGDMEGAIQAFSLLLEMPDKEVTLDMRASALGNRAACCLPLQRYQECIQDCCTAVCLHLQSPSWTLEGSSSSSSSGTGGENSTTSNSSSSSERSTGEDAGPAERSSSSSQLLHAYLAKELAPLLASSVSRGEDKGTGPARAAEAAADAVAAAALESKGTPMPDLPAAQAGSIWGSDGLVNEGGVTPTAAAATAAWTGALAPQQKGFKSTVRLLGRMALAHAYLKEVGPAADLYATGERLALVAGDTHLAGVFHRDRQQLAGQR